MKNVKHWITASVRADPGLTEMARSYGLAGWPLYRDVTLPAVLPSLLQALRVALGLAWLLLIVAELAPAASGVAGAAKAAGARILLYILLGAVAELLARAARRHVLRWHPDYR